MVSVHIRYGLLSTVVGLIVETNCIFEYKPPPHFWHKVVWKRGGGGGRIIEYIRYMHATEVFTTQAWNHIWGAPSACKCKGGASGLTLYFYQ